MRQERSGSSAALGLLSLFAGIAKALAALARRHVSRQGLEHLTGAQVPAGPTSVLSVFAG